MAQTGTQAHPPASPEFLQSVLDALTQHIAVLDRQGRIIATNAAWRRFGSANGLDEGAATCIGVNYFAVCERATGGELASAREAAAGLRAVAEGRQAIFELEYPCPSPSLERWFIMRASRFESGGQTWLAVAHENITQRKLAERAAQDAAEQRRLALEAAHLGTWDHDLESGRTTWDARCRAILSTAADPADMFAALDLVHPDDRPAILQAIARALAVDGAHSHSVEARIVRPDDAIGWIGATGRVIFAGSGRERRPVRATGVLADVTDRRRAEERQLLLLHELNHRIRNLLATVRAVANSTVNSSASLAEFAQGFSARIDAIGRAYTLLAATDWQATGLRSLIDEAVAPYRRSETRNIALSGEDLQLPAEAALPLSLVLHELATNAAKYGALSVPGGRLAVDWRTRRAAEGPQLLLEWTERGGPPVQAPRRRGFGRTVIERSVAHELGGRAELDFAPAGVRCRIEAPLEPKA